jgi:hypothetical protein
MTDEELIERLRMDHPDYLTKEAADRIEKLVKERDEADADRIEQLEIELDRQAVRLRAASAVVVKRVTQERDEALAKLAKAVEALRWVVGYYDNENPFRKADYHNENCDCDRCRFDRARAVLAELEAKE